MHVESQSQRLGANACGSDHNLLYVDWLISSDPLRLSPSNRQPLTRLCFFKDALHAPATREKFQETLAPVLDTYSSAWVSANNAASSSLFSDAEKQVLVDGAYAL